MESLIFLSLTGSPTQFQAQNRWAHRDPQEKKGLVCVLIAGDCDYSDVVRDIRKAGPAPDDFGVEVCIVYSKNSPARSSFLSLVNKHMVVDEWSQMVESSRKSAEESDTMKVTVFPPTMRFLDLMNEKPQLEGKLQQIHPDISLNYGPNFVQLMRTGSVAQDAVDEALQAVRDFRNDIKEGQALEVKGWTAYQLQTDVDLATLAQLNGVSVYVPKGPKGSKGKDTEPAPTLKDNQLLVQSQQDDKWIKDQCWWQCKVSIWQVQWVGKHRVVSIDFKDTNMQQAPWI